MVVGIIKNQSNFVVSLVVKLKKLLMISISVSMRTIMTLSNVHILMKRGMN